MYPDVALFMSINNDKNEIINNNNFYSGYYHVSISSSDKIGGYFIACKMKNNLHANVVKLYNTEYNDIIINMEWEPNERIKLFTSNNPNNYSFDVTVNFYNYLYYK